MKNDLISHGAEATILKLKNNKIKKVRIEKGYRHPRIDKALRKRRTKAEAKILSKLTNTISVPKVYETNEFEMTLDLIHGKKLSENLEKLNYKSICKQIGATISKMHDLGIIHGDLTTSNMIFNPKEKKVYFIDFGLGFHSNRVEDKAVDLHLLSQALEAKHSKISLVCFKEILKGYKKSKTSSQVLKRLEKVKQRGRYKAQY